MRWYLLSAVVFGLSTTDVASHAQGPPAGQRLSASRSTPQDAGFFATTGVVRFHLIQGRLCLDSPSHRKGSQSREQDGAYESITVTAERGIPSLHYVCQTPDQHLTLSVQKAGNVRIESFFPRTSERSVLEQPEIGAVRCVLTRGDLSEEHTGSTLLHVRQQDSTGFQLHYGPLIERLLRGQSLESLCHTTSAMMLRQANRMTTPSDQSIRRSIAQLRSPRRSDRVAAERQLLRWGTPIVPTVQSLISADLDPEQRCRLRRIMRRIRPQVSDTPASLAMLLINDHAYWSLLAPRLTGDQVQLASRHLTRAGFGAFVLDQSEPAERIALDR